MAYIFFSPHIDDAVLSAGGLIQRLLARDKQIRIDYIFSISNWTNPKNIARKHYGDNVIKITTIRKHEEQEIAETLNYGYRFYDFQDRPLRSEGLINSPLLVNQISDRIKAGITKRDYCFFPLGFRHVDHFIIKDIGFALLQDHFQIFFYEDMPYLSSGNYDANEVSQTLSNQGWRSRAIKIDHNRKFELLQLYKSQVSQEWLDCMMNYSFNLVDDNAFYERFWAVTPV